MLSFVLNEYDLLSAYFFMLFYFILFFLFCAFFFFFFFFFFFKFLLVACPTHTNPPGSGLGTGGIVFAKHIDKSFYFVLFVLFKLGVQIICKIVPYMCKHCAMQSLTIVSSRNLT